MPLELTENPVSTDVALSTSAPAADTGSIRANKLIDNHMDVLLHDFRRIKVWDEMLRRKYGATNTWKSNYKPWNPAGNFELWDESNTMVSQADVTVSWAQGEVTVSGTDEAKSFFATFEYNMFPAAELKAMLDLSLSAINTTAEQGTYVTTYGTLDEAPAHWDMALVAGAMQLAYTRIASDSAFWSTYLIFVDGSAGAVGQQMASASAQYFQTIFQGLASGSKRQKFIALPGVEYQRFAQRGFGFSPPFYGNWRGLQVNHSGVVSV